MEHLNILKYSLDRMDVKAIRAGTAKLYDALISKFGDQKHPRPLEVALGTLEIVKGFISHSAWGNTRDLLDTLQPLSKELYLSDHAFAPFSRNMVLRILKLIRDDYKQLQETYPKKDDDSTGEGWDAKPSYEEKFPELRERLIESFDELTSETELNATNIANQAAQHIHSNDVVLTVGRSLLVETFLKNAVKKGRFFHLVVVEGGSDRPGHILAENMGAEGISVTLVPDSAVFAVMSTVNKVILGAHLVLANGGIKTSLGCLSVALAASHYAVPVVVCSSMYELTPKFPGTIDPCGLNVFKKPTSGKNRVHDLGPEFIPPFYMQSSFEYVAPDFISIFIFSSGGNVPSYMYSVMNELYSPDDMTLDCEISAGVF